MGSYIPPYAILSRTASPCKTRQTNTNTTPDTWSDEEVTLQHLAAGANNSSGSLPLNLQASLSKITKTCALAHPDLNYAWVDTCCIDKTNGAELSEAINSMWAWYRDSAVCYVFLADLKPGSEADLEGEAGLAACRWFTRGWTLQELVAPREVLFFDQEWNSRGGKHELAGLLAKITGIPEEVLWQGGEHLDYFAVAKRMSWAARRETTRGEDMAYCLMGLFDVNMPLLYGEGMAKAFARLQMTIIQSTGDMSIFAWVDDRVPCRQFAGMLAESPRQFATCGDIEMLYGDRAKTNFAITSRGIQTEARQAHNQRARDGEWRLALDLFCRIEGSVVGVSVQKTGTGVCVRRNPGVRVMLCPSTATWDEMIRSGLRVLPLETLTLATKLPSQSLFSSRPSPVLNSRRSVFRVNWGPLALDYYEAFPKSNWDAHDGVFFTCSGDSRAWAVCYLNGTVRSEAAGERVSVDLVLACFAWGSSKKITVILASRDNLRTATSAFMRLHLNSITFENANAAQGCVFSVFEGKLEEEVIDTDLGPVRYFKDSGTQVGGVKPALTVANMRREMRPDVCVNPVIVLDLSHATR